MNEKKKNIIITSINLFADKGFHSTSIQEIAEKSNVSKGAFYLHFHSKDELLLEIFKYYFDLMQENVKNAIDVRLSPKDNFIKQVEVQFNEIIKHKSFILTQFKEQAISLNKELFDFIRMKEYETHIWYKETFISIYGEPVTPYVIDLANIFEGIKQRYIQIIIHGDISIDIPKLASFLVNRLDDVAGTLVAENVEPILSEESLENIFSVNHSPEKKQKKEVNSYLLDMQKILHENKPTPKIASELQDVLDFLITEVNKKDSKEFVIQGLLANFKGIDEFDKYRQLISEKLNIRLL
ncbi:TetR/AcrR family transcriptional regulator [Virgibacillus flavescens]|uniref:TetR/AcrR family transcriptional regulator n=1 Tax=Virgibacillus flavescens TaxID=1611422 RepID=UPI003D32E61B